MKAHPVRLGVVLIALVAALTLAACSSGAASGASSSTQAQGSDSAALSGSSEAAPSYSSLPEGVDTGNVMTISLDYSAGTGFEWTYEADPEGLVEFVDKATESQSSQKDTAGGPLQDKFTFRAKAPGELKLTFNLVRDWETDSEPAETQVYALVINDDLDFIVNPYDSKFDHEPEWSTEG